jgi:hypothetical protein
VSAGVGSLSFKIGVFMGYQVVSSKTDVAKLAAGLLDARRRMPWCVVSHTVQAPTSYLNLDGLASSVAEIAEVFLIAHGELTYHLSDLLPEGTGVYGDAARLYQRGFSKQAGTFDVPRYLLDVSNSKRLQVEIENDIWKNADLGTFKKDRGKREVAQTGKVVKVYPPSVAVVELANGMRATIRQEVCFPGIPIHWFISEQDELNGTWDEANSDFIPNGTKLTLKEVVEHYGFGHVVLGLVKSSERQTGIITVFPGVDIKITREEISGNDRDLVLDFLDVGDVVAARLYRDPQGRTGLRMDDIDDDEIPLPALPILEEGRPWLVEAHNEDTETTEFESDLETEEPEVLKTAVEATPTSTIGLPGPGVVIVQPANSTALGGRERSDFQFQVKVLNGRIQDLEGRLKARELDVMALSAELRDVESNLAGALHNYREERKKSTAAKRQGARIDNGKSTTQSRRSRWITDEDWFGEELRRAWVGRYKPEDRKEFALDLAKVSYGREFFNTLRESHISEEDLRKIVRVVLDIVTDRNSRERMHEVHPLRESASSSARNLTREDGAICFRAYVEENTAQAKRLHFWKVPNGWELSRVGLHDDMRA